MTLRQPITLFEIDKPRCSRTYGVAPCAAVLGTTGDDKCFNSRKSCQDPANLDLSETVTLRFSEPQEGVEQYGPVIPSITSVTTQPLTVNLGGMESSVAPLGDRESVTIKVKDHPYSDLLTDKYRLERETGKAQGGGAISATQAGGGGVSVAAWPSAPATAVTVEAWVNTTTFFDWANLVNWNWGTAGGWLLFTDHTGMPIFGVYGPAAQQFAVLGAPAMNAGQTYHLVGTYDGATVRLYVNGVQVGTPVAAVQALYTTPSALQLPQSLTGKIDGVRIYDRALSAAEVAEHYLGRYKSSGLIGWWDFDEIPLPSSTAEDSAAGHDGAFVGDAARVDPLYASVGYKPIDRGTMWPKFIARDPYYIGYICRIREGYIGDAIADMRVREYVLDQIDGPADGVVTIKAKDLFSLIEKRKAKAPAASTGELSADLTGSPASFTLAPAGIGDSEYGPLETLMGTLGAGHVAIGDEIIQYTRSGDTMTVVARGALGTTQDDHKQDDVVQWVLSFSVEAPHDVIYTLLTGFSDVPTAKIPKADWDVRMSANADFYTTHIAKPTPVEDLIGEVVEEAGLTVWPDVSTGLIELRPLRSGASVATLDDDSAFVDDKQFLPVRAEEKRISEVWVYYGQINPLEDQKEPKNYHSRLVKPTGTGSFYGSDSAREIFSRWIPQGGRSIASRTANRIAAMFADTPIETTFTLNAEKAADLGYADYVDVQAFELQDLTGAPATVTQAITAIKRAEEDVEFKAQSIAFAEDDDGVRRLYLENTGLRNVNLRTLHDASFPAPTAGVQVEFIIADGTIVGSTSASVAAIRSGTWDPAVSVTLKGEGPGMGRIQGKGGNGPDGGSYLNGFNGAAGQNGGDALQADSLITVDPTYLEIWAGGGAGGAGGGMRDTTSFWGGGAGAPGAGEDPGAGGAAGAELNVYDPGLESTGSTTATTEAAGSPGLGGRFSGGGPVRQQGGNGGAGGGPGQDGSAGQAAQNGTGTGTVIGTGGAGGTKGRAVVNSVNVTFTGGPGDIRGTIA